MKFRLAVLLGIAAVALWGMRQHASAADGITFSEQIAPIIYANCTACHRPGEAAPFALMSYADVKARGRLIAQATKARYMPPWHAEHDFGEFAQERRLTDQQIVQISAWVQDGMPEGDPAKAPPVPMFTEGWHLGTPDLILEMPIGFDVPASGPDIYRNFTIPTGVTEDKWVRAVEFRPSARKVVHHVLFAYDGSGTLAALSGRDGKPGFGGMGSVGVGGTGPGNSGSLGGWAVGNTPTFLSDGLALPLPKGSDFVLQMHFHPTGKPETEKSTVGIYFAARAPEHKLFPVQAPALFGIGTGLDIPPGATRYTINDTMTLPVDIAAYAVSAHAHYIGKEMKATATLPDGTVTPLLWIKDWNFAWQDRYTYKAPVSLPQGTRLDVQIAYDNSGGNPRNPRTPPGRVQWGEQSIDEMGSVTVQAIATHPEDEPALQRFLAERTQQAIRRAVQDGTVRRLREEQAAQGVAQK
jgi:hypothetical protein